MSETYSQLVEGLHAETSGHEVVMREEKDGGPYTRSGGPMAATVDRVMSEAKEALKGPREEMFASSIRIVSIAYGDLLNAAIRRAAVSCAAEHWPKDSDFDCYRKELTEQIERHVRRELGLENQPNSQTSSTGGRS